MENNNGKTTGNNDFQYFSPMSKPSSVLVSNQLKEDLECIHYGEYNQNVILVQKYLPIDRFIDSILHHYFYMASPSTWDDPFETKYLEVLKHPENGLCSKEKSAIEDMSIFCTCMTYNTLESEEASWKSYDTDKENIIRVSYDFNKFCEILNNRNDGKIYVGKMFYKQRTYILKRKTVEKGTADDFETLYVNNFCLKQIAYQYEKELRFCKILNGEQYKEQKGYKIDRIDLSPAIIRITLPPINHKNLTTEKSKTGIFEQVKKSLILKTICPKVPIHVSNLYDSSEIEMTSELTL